MAWARIDDAFDDHPKVLALLDHEQGGAAIGLWTLCLTWAHRNTLRKGKTPGLLPAHLPRRYLGPGARELAALLVKEELWESRDEGDGWLIHDFDQYLPTPKTREARAQAGRRGAQARWAKRDADGPESKPDSNLPSNPDNLPKGSHDVAGKPMASDGSRAPAHRAISNEIAPIPEPKPVPATPAQAARTEQATTATAGTLVAEWIRACRKRPPDRVIGQISAELKKLLDEGQETDDIRAGLEQWRIAAKHPSTLASFVNGITNGGGGTSEQGHQTFRNPADPSVYNEELRPR
jgi:hypothetical protein